MRKAVITLIIITSLSKLLGFARELLLAFFYGSSDLTDVYFISLTIPETLYAFIGVALTTSLVPIYSELKENHPFNLGINFINNTIFFILISCTFISITVWLLTPQIVKVFATGFSGETQTLAVTFTRITVFSIYFRGILYIFKGYLQVHENFVLSEITGLFFNLFIIMIIPISFRYGYLLLPIGFVVGRFLQVSIIVPVVKKYGYTFKVYFNRNDKYFKRMITLAIPGIFGISINQLNTVIDRSIASTVQVGGISALNYANRITLLVDGVIVFSIVTVLYSLMSKLVAKKDIKALKKQITDSFNLLIVIIIPITFLFMFNSEQIIKIIYGRGAFDNQAIKTTSIAFFFYSLGMVALALRDIITRAFYALQDTKTPTINASIALVINVILNIVLSRYLGIGGLALATSIAAFVSIILLVSSFTKKIGALELSRTLKLTIKIMIISSLSLYISERMSFISNVYINFFLKSIVFGCSFILFSLLYKVEEVKHLWSLIRKKTKWN